MKSIYFALLSFSLLIMCSCGNNYQKQIDDLQEQVDELRSDLERYTYDYKEDSNTIVVDINDENLDEYFNLVIVENSNGYYDVILHSLMYDKGYVLLGGYCSEIEWRQFNGINISSRDYISSLDYPCPICVNINQIDVAQSYADKGIQYSSFHLSVLYDDAKLYYQKIEDVRYGYEIKDGFRCVNGDEYRDIYIFEKYPY